MSPNTEKKVSEKSREEANDTDESKSKIRLLPEKKFELRNSQLTDLFEDNPHIKTVYNIFVAIFFTFFINTIIQDYLLRGEIDVGFRLIFAGFGNFHIAILAWLVFFTTTCLCFICFHFWARVRIKLFPKSTKLKIWDMMWLTLLIGYYVLIFKVSPFFVRRLDLALVSSGLFLIEQVRMLMKIHAFVRSNAPKVLSYKAHSESQLILPSFSKFVYFFFAPTLVYSDEYPRTTKIRKTFIIHRSLEIIAISVLYACLLKRFLLPHYSAFGLRKFTWGEVITSILENAAIGIFLKIGTAFLILHSVQNLFAELLRFGDRLFYKNWWTSTSYVEYFRTWNLVVSDWLYTYIYKDVYEIIAPKNKTLSKVAVFVISAVVHEWILTCAINFFFPAMFCFFLLGAALESIVRMPRTIIFRILGRQDSRKVRNLKAQEIPDGSFKGTIWNALFLYGLSVGAGILMSLYTLEFFARANIPVTDSSWRSYLLPRWLTCGDCIGN